MTTLPFASVRLAMCNVNSSWILTPSTPSGEEVVTAYLLPIQPNIDRAIAATECIEVDADIDENVVLWSDDIHMLTWLY